MADNMKDTLIRAYTMDMRRNHGNVVVAEVLRQRVTFDVLTKPGTLHDVPGAILLDSADALGAIANAITRNVHFLVFIRATDELVWIPTKAELSIADWWRIEMVPWVEYLRASSEPDSEIIRKAHLEP